MRIIAAAAIAIVAAAITFFVLKMVRADDEDRPPIIVRSGSVLMDGGDSGNWKPWKQNGSKKQWKPDHGGGGSVKSFSVTVANATGNAAPSSPCPTLPMLADKVVVEYTTSGGEKSQVTISIITSGSKKEPLVDAPADMTQVPGSGSTPDQIIYDPGAGYISNVTVTNGSAQQLCGYEKPTSGPGSAHITVKPNR
jgi:hypothetical protein